MKNILFVLLTTIFLNGCVENKPENIFHEYILSLKNANFNELIKTLSPNHKDMLFGYLIKECSLNNHINNEVMYSLKNENLEIERFNIVSYESFSNELKDKTLNLCFKTIVKDLIQKTNNTTTKIIETYPNSTGNVISLKYEEKTLNGQVNYNIVKLEKIDNEWKITKGII